MPLSAADDGDSEVDDEGAATAESSQAVYQLTSQDLWLLCLSILVLLVRSQSRTAVGEEEEGDRDVGHLEERFFVVLVMVTAQILWIESCARFSQKTKSTSHPHFSVSVTVQHWCMYPTSRTLPSTS